MAAAKQEEDKSNTVSRVCIKGLPPACTESKLQSHLTASNGSGAHMIVTDCKILRTKDGISRKLAFVGFKSPTMAQHAVSYFNRTYLGTSKIYVDFAFSKGSNTTHNNNNARGEGKDGGGGSSGGGGGGGEDGSGETNYRPWSKYSAGSSKYDSIHNITKQLDQDHLNESSGSGSGSGSGNNNNNEEEKSTKQKEMDRKKEEFLSVMMGSKKGSGTMWGNDDGITVDTNMKTNAKTKTKTNIKDNVKDNTKDEKRVGMVGKKMDIDSDSDSSSSSSSSSSSDDENTNDKEQSKETTTSQTNDNEDTPPPTTTTTTTTNEDKEEEFSTDRLFVRNLPFHATEEEINELFSSFGTIIECHLPVDDTNRNKGYAFVKFTSSQDAIQAREQLDGSSFQGRLIHLLPARPERDNKEGGGTNAPGGEGVGGGSSSGNGSELTFKKQMEMARQKEAANTTAGWSTNFVRGDAVVDNLADRFGLDKGAVFNVKDGLSSGNAAVRLALGETQILEENREYFSKHGIQMDDLMSSSESSAAAAKRSSTMILVKNLPYDTTYDELAKLFLAFGGDANILLPPSRTIALVDFKNRNDSKKAFRKLSYKRFKHVPLYLEWAPLSIKIQLTPSTNSTTSTNTGTNEENQTNELKDDNVPTGIVNKKEDEDNEEDNEEAEQGSASIYVKNLNFSTTENEVKKTFEDIIGKHVRSVRIPTKVAPMRSNKSSATRDNPKVQQMSLGYGFVECSTDEAARKAIRLLQGTIVNGHAMELKVSSKSGSTNTKVSKVANKKSSKLIVRNVPFQASRTDILQLFGSFGQLKTVRLPKKFDGGHRGFAFVEFTAAKEAQNAMKSLSQTHLYGRHLVLEWADDKEDLETLRGKAKRDSGLASSGGNGKNKKIRFN